MPQPDEIRQKLKKKRSRELRAYFREVVQQEGFFAALSRTIRYVKRRWAPKRGRYLPKRRLLDNQRLADTTGWVKISVVVPVYNPSRQHFEDLVQSVVGQTYRNWELCLADASEDNDWIRELINRYDSEKILYRAIENGGISENTNEAARLATGQYIAFADHDDVLAPHALYEVARQIAEFDPPMLYSDEALFERNWMYPTVGHFKPHYSPQYLLNVNYFGHLVAIRKNLFDRLGGLRKEYDGAQDHDFNLRALEVAGSALHIPKVLYYWRQHKDSTSTGIEAKPYVAEAAKKAIDDHLRRIGVRGWAADGLFPSTYKVDYAIKGRPFVSIIIPNCDHIPDLDRCIRSIYEKTRYLQFEVIVVENNSQVVDTFSYYEELVNTYPRCKVVVYDESKNFNFPLVCNYGRQSARGHYLLFLNNDTEVITPEWIDEMLQLCQLEEIAVVGAMLYYPDNTVQHAGVITGLGGYAGHSHKYAYRGKSGYMFRQACVQELSAVTGACMMVKTEVFDQVGGFDAGFSVAYNDVDFCLRVRRRGKSVVFTPYAELYHHESKSRGSDEEGEAAARFAAEQEKLLERYGEDLLFDPYYNPNLTQDREDFSESDVLPAE
ncbi:glycosyltransferase family 2 protein [Ruminococcaceae bacterium OttesenSCG-928-I18]|nr:glycosyltransferase family 2 protein [Ruminococcaceae bacterium OttesenSCG-928-I18]